MIHISCNDYYNKFSYHLSSHIETIYTGVDKRFTVVHMENNTNFSQDGGIDRNPSLPHTSKRRITTNLKSINNQKCQKIKLHGTLTTMELKKQSNRTSRPVRQQMETAVRWQAVREGLI